MEIFCWKPSVFFLYIFYLIFVGQVTTVPDLVKKDPNGSDIDQFGLTIFNITNDNADPVCGDVLTLDGKNYMENSCAKYLTNIEGINMISDFKFFGRPFDQSDGTTNSGQAKIHFNGFLSFGTYSQNIANKQACFHWDKSPSPSKYLYNFLAPYWMRYFEGSVHFFELSETDHSNDWETIFADLQQTGFNLDTNSAKERILVFTWLRMSSDGTKNGNVFEEKLMNTFQLYLILHGGVTYAQFYYRALDTNHLVIDDDVGTTCYGQVGIARDLKNLFGTESVGYRLGRLPQVAEYYSNVNNNDVGSWVYCLAATQMYQEQEREDYCENVGENIKCEWRMAAIQTIEATASAPIKNTPINTQVGISLPRRSDRFCEYRDDGKFVFPLDCRGYFICDGGKVSFASCPEGEHFHPKLRRCVDEKQSSCFSKMPVQSDMVVTYLPTAKNYKPRDVIKTLHKLWTVNIHLKPRGISTFRGYTSAFYAVAPMEGVFRSVKYRTPSILFESGTTRLQVCGVLNYPSPSTCQTISTPLPLNKFTRVQIQQIPNGADSKFIVKYNRTTMWIGKPTNLRAFHNVLVYHWDNSDSGIRPANAETKRCKFYSGITQGHLIETIKKLYNTWTLQITLLPLGIRDSDSNILHVTQYLNSAREGLLKLDFMDSTSHLRICSPSITSKSSNGCIILPRPLEINKLVTITIQRRQTTKGGYDLVITLTGSQFFSIRFNDAVSRVLEDVNVYVSDSWMPSANAVLDAYQFSTKIK